MLKPIWYSLILACIFFHSFVFAQNAKVEEFVITIYDRSIKVSSPDSLKNTYSVVLENRSMSKVLGKIQSSSGKVYSINSIESNSFAKVTVENKKGERVFFIPLAPPFQEAELIAGRKTYEIPPKH